MTPEASFLVLLLSVRNVLSPHIKITCGAGKNKGSVPMILALISLFPASFSENMS